MGKILNKKILIWIDDSSYFQYCIASLVQEQVNCKVYAVADVNENSKKFLQNQTFVKFENLKKSGLFQSKMQNGPSKSIVSR